MAECCAAQAGLDRVLFVPAAAQPLKPGGAVASAADRLAMVAAAIAEDARFEASTVEIDRGGASYTVDTLATLAAERPGDELFFLMGADSLADIAKWRQPERICELATPLVVARAGEPPVDLAVLAPYVTAERLAEIEKLRVETPPASISSTELRRRIAGGEPWKDQVPPPAAEYIRARGLYRP